MHLTVLSEVDEMKPAPEAAWTFPAPKINTCKQARWHEDHGDGGLRRDNMILKDGSPDNQTSDS